MIAARQELQDNKKKRYARYIVISFFISCRSCRAAIMLILFDFD